LPRWQRVGVLVAPWVFVIAFAWIWVALLVPRALDGHPALVCISFLAGVALACFFVAAVTFSRDVLRGRWP
jgi:uncharacterized membrane protein